MVGGNTVREAQICMTLGGEVYANGMDMHGATAAINIETTDSVNVNDNVSLHQGIDSPSPGHGWARQYAQTSHAGYMIDMCLSGGDDNTSSPTPTEVLLISNNSCIYSEMDLFHGVVTVIIMYTAVANSYQAWLLFQDTDTKEVD